MVIKCAGENNRLWGDVHKKYISIRRTDRVRKSLISGWVRVGYIEKNGAEYIEMVWEYRKNWKGCND